MYEAGDTVHCDEWDGVIVGFLQSEISGDSSVIGLIGPDGELTEDVEIIPCWWLDDVGAMH